MRFSLAPQLAGIGEAQKIRGFPHHQLEIGIPLKCSLMTVLFQFGGEFEHEITVGLDECNCSGKHCDSFPFLLSAFVCLCCLMVICSKDGKKHPRNM